ncbi:hypothetical protein QCA50_016922 [Cerrena zonata]|uniref:F-box domain-containing protein n=1 Tax=Cerrena zonata TaxID=2478898 RepID=A0AAW0FCD2_9APHY
MTLDVTSLLRISRVCRQIHSISLSKQLWVRIYFRDITTQGLPFAPYWKDIDALNAKQLKGLIMHTLRLDHRLSLSYPPIERPFYQRRSVTWVRLVQSQWLLVASSDDITSVITLWSVVSLLTSRSSAPLAEASLSAPVVTGAVDVNGSHVTLAVELSGRIPQIEILTIVKHRNSIMFSRLQTLDGVASLRLLQGDFIGVSLIDNTNVPCIIGWKSGIATKLRYLPDLQGGAVAMHMDNGWIAVVRRSILEVYLHDGTRYKRWKVVELSHGVGTASFRQIIPRDNSGILSASLRLCIVCSAGLFVYEVLCNPGKNIVTLDDIWHHADVLTPSHIPVLINGGFGTTGESVSWLHGHTGLQEFPVRFATARLPTEGNPRPTISEWHDVNMPALYSLGVYDYDEARGVLVLGNAYGELSLYDFSHSDPRLFGKCLATKLTPTPRSNQEILPTHRIPSYPAPPFPSWENPEYIKDDLFQFWSQHGVVGSPPGWSRDFESVHEYLPWHSPFLGRGSGSSFAFRALERAGHFYGRPVPLLHTYNALCHYDLAIVDVGGLLFLKDSDEPVIYIVDEGITLEQLVASVHQGWFPAKEVPLDITEMYREILFYSMMLHERRDKGRNRCLELYRRGGRVNPRFLQSEPPQQD